MTESGRPGPGGRVEDLERDAAWLALQQRVAARAAHEVKNALNGVAVNVEVVRARAGRGAGADQIAPFADAAGAQLEGAVALVESLLALARPARASADAGGVAGILRSLAPLVAAPGRAVDVVAESTAVRESPLDGALLRLVLAAGLVAAADAADGLDDAGGIRCRVEPDRAGDVRVHIRGARPAELPPDVVRLAARAGVTCATADGGIELKIPAAENR